MLIFLFFFQERDPACIGGRWLSDQLESYYAEKKNTCLRLPVTPDGNLYDVHKCFEDQQDVIAYVMQYVKMWIEHASSNETCPVKPL